MNSEGGALRAVFSPTRAEWWAKAVTAVATSIAILLAALCVFEVVISSGLRTPLAAVVGLVGIAGLTLRRAHPVAVLGAELAVAVAIGLVSGSLVSGGPLTTVAIFVVTLSLYMVGTTSGRTSTGVRTIGAAAASWAVLSAAQVLGGSAPHVVGSTFVLVTAVTAICFYISSQRALLESYRDRAEAAEREQRLQTTRAVEAERVRIARELHDVVAHHVSLLVVQAGAVRETLPADETIRPLLDSMIDGGRHAMTELRDMLGALRVDAPADEAPGAGIPAGAPVAAGSVPPRAPRAPQPDADQIPELVRGARLAGLGVEIDIAGLPVPLPPTTSLAAYRIVQESLTNVVKHAPTSSTRVYLLYGPDAIELTVTSTAGRQPTGAARSPGRAGHGLTGMRERATLAHGQLAAGPCDDGWEVRAILPIGTSPAGEARRAGAGPVSAGAPGVGPETGASTPGVTVPREASRS